MSKSSVFDHGWIDLVFEGRNKAYGAYELRKQDGRTTVKAFFSAMGLMALLIAIPVVMNSFKPAPVPGPTITGKPIVEVGTIHEIDMPPKPIEPPKTEDAAPAAKNPNKTVKFTQPIASSEPTPDNPPTTTQVNNNDVSNVASEGTGREIIIEPTSPAGVPGGTGKGPADTAGTGTGIEYPATVDVMPEFPGGIDKFLKTVGSKFEVPETNRVMQLKVYVTFVVEIDGSMTNIKVGRDPGYNMAAEAERVLKSIKTKWKPGKKKGVPVRTAYSLPIVVNVK